MATALLVGYNRDEERFLPGFKYTGVWALLIAF